MMLYITRVYTEYQCLLYHGSYAHTSNLLMFLERLSFRKLLHKTNTLQYKTITYATLRIKEVLHLLPQISMFCALSKNYQKSFWKMIYACYSKLFKELINGIDILIGQAIFKLWIKTIKMLFGSITQEPLGLPKLWCIFWVPWTIY